MDWEIHGTLFNYFLIFKQNKNTMKKWIVAVAFMTAAGTQFEANQEVNEDVFNGLTDAEKENLQEVASDVTAEEITSENENNVVDNDAEGEEVLEAAGEAVEADKATA